MFRLARSCHASSLFKIRSSKFNAFHTSRMFTTIDSSSENTEKEKELIQLTVPFVGDNISNIKFNKWNIQVGEPVNHGDLIAELQQVGSPHLAIDVFSHKRGIMKEQLINEGDIVNCGDVISTIEIEKLSQEELDNEFNHTPPQQQQEQPQSGSYSFLLDIGIVIVGCLAIYTSTQQKETDGSEQETKEGNLEIVQEKPHFAYFREFLKNKQN